MLISVILEWENALMSELGRTELMLSSLYRQSVKVSDDFELIIVFDPNKVKKDFIKKFVLKEIPTESKFNQDCIHFIERQGLHYFSFKNTGVQEARGQAVLLVDSDVIPEEDWLPKLLEAHYQHSDGLVSGLTYIDFSNFIGKCFALCWFFPLPSSSQSLVPTDLIFSNNFLVSRNILLQNPYPEMQEGVTRGADTLLWKRMREKHIPFYVHHGARVSHPAPNGVSHFFTRALAEGRDDYLKFFENEFKRSNPRISFIKTYLLRSWKCIQRTLKNRRVVNVNWWQSPFVILTMLTYYLTYFVGGVCTMILPQHAKKAWQI
ncbi:glycosyltransferase [Algoriphagus namhaensis]|uniref:Glycosyltransferase n=1 Tax=Algoriphagus namhaensis TaxID=915353 RepID=A0ABV8AS02_9BACT